MKKMYSKVMLALVLASVAIKTGGFVIPQQKERHSPLLRISNPQIPNRLGPFLTPDFKSGGTPGGLAFLAQRRLSDRAPARQRLKRDPARRPGGFAIRRQKMNRTPLGDARNATPLGVPADLQSAVKKCSTY